MKDSNKVGIIFGVLAFIVVLAGNYVNKRIQDDCVSHGFECTANQQDVY